MKTYGLIGYRLGHSFSKRFFSEKFESENIDNHEYINFELDTVADFHTIFETGRNICGLNCTIPYKQQIIPLLDELDPEAAQIGAVNTIKIVDKNGNRYLKGYNTDSYGFENSLLPMLDNIQYKALILGTGGASKAIKHVMSKLHIDYVSATTKENCGENEIGYKQIDAQVLQNHLIIVQATPLGTFPKVDECPDIPYQFLTPNHVCFDLVYNPEETLFLKKSKEKGAKTKNGLEMLHLQAIRAWDIWNS